MHRLAACGHSDHLFQEQGREKAFVPQNVLDKKQSPPLVRTFSFIFFFRYSRNEMLFLACHISQIVSNTLSIKNSATFGRAVFFFLK